MSSTTPSPVPGRPSRRASIAGAIVALLLLVGACASPSPSVTPTPLTSNTPRPSASGGSPTSSPTATPEPPFSLALPSRRDVRRIRVAIAPSIPASGTGRLTVTVTSLASQRITEIVLRWPTTLEAILWLSPFQPSASRLTDALVQPWTKWVIGPGEMGEPAGTASLGWGPLDPGATLTIPIVVTRRQAGPVAFDLQFLAGEALLTTDQGGPAETRVSVP